MERGDLAEFGKKNATQIMIFLPIENVGLKIKTDKLLLWFFCSKDIVLHQRSKSVIKEDKEYSL